MGRKLKIGVLAPPWLTVPPQTYGGTELIVDILCRGFKEAGHEPILFAAGDSSCPVELNPSFARAEMPPDKYKEHAHIAHFLKQASELDLDVIHSHLEGLQPYSSLLQSPIICTLHVEITPARTAFLSTNTGVTYVAVSADQADSFPMDTEVIHHGIELHRYPFESSKREYFLFLGEISRRKGVDSAVSIVRQLDRQLKIAGYLPPAEEQWFLGDVMTGECKGLVDFIGPVGFAEKISLLSDAAALLTPIRWREPFGLVLIEAMACGTPVVANARGALPELIEHGVTGFLCNNDDELMHAANHVGQIDPVKCRKRVESLFDHRRMVEDYLRLFEDCISVTS